MRVWVTAAHKGIHMGQHVEVIIRRSAKRKFFCCVAHVFIESDLAVIESDEGTSDDDVDVGVGEFLIDEDLFATKLSFVCGFKCTCTCSSLAYVGHTDATVITCNIAKEKVFRQCLLLEKLFADSLSFIYLIK